MVYPIVADANRSYIEWLAFCVGVYCLRAMDPICHREHVVLEAASRIKRGPQWAGVNCGPLSGRLTRPYTGWLVINERQMNKRALEGARTNPQKNRISSRARGLLRRLTPVVYVAWPDRGVWRSVCVRRPYNFYSSNLRVDSLKDCTSVWPMHPRGRVSFRSSYTSSARRIA